MPTLKDIDRVFEFEANAAIAPPFIFPTSLPQGGTVNLGSIAVPARRAGYIVRAVVNWSVTFTPPLLTVTTLPVITSPGFAQVTFEILRDGGPIAREVQTNGQAGFSVTLGFTAPSTAFAIATLQILDTTLLSGVANPITTFSIQATGINLVAPVLTLGTATVSAAAGLVSLIVEEVDACRAEAMKV